MKKFIPIISAAIALSLAPNALTGDQALLDLLVEKGLVTSGEAAALQKEAASKPSRVNVTSSSQNLDSLQIRGRIQAQAGYVRANNDNGSGSYHTAELRRVRLGIRGQLAQNVRAQFEGNYAPNSFSVRTAFLQWREHDFAHVKVGADKPVFGYEENTSSASIKTVERSLITNTLRPNVVTGLTVNGKLGSMFYYSTGVYTDRVNTNTAGESSKYLTGLSGGLTLDDLLPEEHKLGLRFDMLYSNDDGGRFGADSKNGFAASAHYRFAPFDLRMEYLQGRKDGDTTRGWYIMPSFYATDNLEFVFRYEQAKSDSANGLGAAGRYASRVDGNILANAEDRQGDDYYAFYLGANYYFAGDQHKVMLGVERSQLDTVDAGDLKATTVFSSWRMLF